MDFVLLLYSSFLLIVYSISLPLPVFLYIHTKKPLYLYLSTVLGLFLLDSVIINATESISWFSTFYDYQFMSVPSFKTIIVAVILLCFVLVNTQVLQYKYDRKFVYALILLFVYMMFLPMMYDSAVKVWLYYTPQQVFMFALSFYGIRVIRKNPEDYRQEMHKKYLHVLMGIAVCSILIIAEDTYVIFNIDVYTESHITIVNRNVTEDLLRIFCVFSLVPFLGTKILKMLGNDGSTDEAERISSEPLEREANLLLEGDEALEAGGEAEPEIDLRAGEGTEPEIAFNAEAPLEAEGASELDNDYSKFYLFCREYQFTVREQDIFRLLLKNKNYSEISEELYISIGTAKAHMHNIFKKTEVKKRSQLIALFENFKKKEL
ncbi:MAG: helix-turn-helix transcriptional regulator [Lachnospiraceae bacterium]|nr:helix-turn-helix transcriptional regulator [Lachnospiraceae bacterium]